MRARHRLSNLLLRRSIIYSGGDAWTGKHDRWLRQQAGPQLRLRGTQVAFEAAGNWQAPLLIIEL